ncbi:signal peptide, CUB and EGF-like domain-containing protein 3 [Onthophagus taurus]|uniref:signal peptide, CUB and EGF-like domain-containing protein 3 n=1 Tax=Onthophagus taurus TaxID=166361 RepID=UPI0039BE78A7
MNVIILFLFATILLWESSCSPKTGDKKELSLKDHQTTSTIKQDKFISPTRSCNKKKMDYFKRQKIKFRSMFEKKSKAKKKIEAKHLMKTLKEINSFLKGCKMKLKKNKIQKSNFFDNNQKTNLINYGNLMNIKSTTLPPFKNITLKKIIKEFNAINNEIQEIIPQKADFYKKKLIDEKYFKTNRCKLKKGGCDHKCHHFGMKPCSCMKGFRLVNRKKCVDINECLTNNGNCEIFCHNLPSSYYCSCKNGFQLSSNQKTCIDINECLLRNNHGPCQDSCENTPGSYKCSCKNLNGTKLAEDKHSCEDIDECLNNFGCSHDCINTLGRAYCLCPDGMVLGPDWKTCFDLDECENEEIKKSCRYGCINTLGSYRCANNYELQNDEMIVDDLVVCPKLLPPKLGFLQCSREKSLEVNLRSKSGRKRVTNRPGTFCQLICPDGFKIDGMFKITCGYDGVWFGEQSGYCNKDYM